MQILTYPIGIVVGMLAIRADLGPSREPAELLLDGLPACALTATVSQCMVDVGTAPRVHLLELVRRDADGDIVERVTRWVNKPGSAEAEVHVSVDCATDGAGCTLTPSWIHPSKQPPHHLRIELDGVPVFDGAPGTIPGKLPLRRGRKAQTSVLTADALFSDGRRATEAIVIGAEHAATTDSTLQAIPVTLGPQAPGHGDLDRWLRAEKVTNRPLEEGEAAITFVIEPSALQAAPGLFANIASKSGGSSSGRRGSPTSGDTTSVPQDLAARRGFETGKAGGLAGELNGVDRVLVVVANEGLNEFDARAFGADPAAWPKALAEGPSQLPGTSIRTPDALLAAAYSIAARPTRRAIVVIVGASAEGSGAKVLRDEGRFRPSDAQHYLQEIVVPLEVWRVGNVPREDAWGGGRRIQSLGDFRAAVAGIARTLGRQRLVWVDGDSNPATLNPSLPAGVALARCCGDPADPPQRAGSQGGENSVLTGAPEDQDRPAPMPATPSFGILTAQVLVDVVVRNKRREAVSGLKQDDFALFEDGKRQVIASFQPIDASVTAPVPSPSGPMARPLVTRKELVLILDDFSLSPAQFGGARAAVENLFRENWNDGDSLALILPAAGISRSFPLAHGQTGAISLLASQKGVFRPRNLGSATTDLEAYQIHVLRDDRITDQVARRFVAAGEVPGSTDLEKLERALPLARSSAATTYAEGRSRRRALLDTTRKALGWLASRPGRRALVLVSPGFILESEEQVLRELSRASFLANAPVHFLDARGLGGDHRLPDEQSSLVTGSDFGTSFSDGQLAALGAEALAVETGGLLVNSQNNLSSGLKQIVDAARIYYLLGYEATNAAGDAKYRRLRVEVADKTLTTHARKGYFPAAAK